MAAASWPAALAFVWLPSNDGQHLHTEAHDSGGATNMGVTAATWATAIEHGLVSGDLAAATDRDLALVLRTMFWNVVQGDALPAGVDLAVFNFAMAAGPGRAARVLQRDVGVTQDGQIGPLTLAAVAGQPAPGIIAALTNSEESFYAGLAAAKYFLRGWDRRAEDCRIAALAIIGAPTNAA